MMSPLAFAKGAQALNEIYATRIQLLQVQPKI